MIGKGDVGKNDANTGRRIMTVVPVTSQDLDAAEVSWFSALCSDDYDFLGVPNRTSNQAGNTVATYCWKPKHKDLGTSSAHLPIKLDRTRSPLSLDALR